MVFVVQYHNPQKAANTCTNTLFPGSKKQHENIQRAHNNAIKYQSHEIPFIAVRRFGFSATSGFIALKSG